jgi:kynureninase
MVVALRLRPDRRVIVVEPSTFPTDGYVAQGVARLTGAELRWCDPADPLAAVDEDVALLSLTHVDFRTGAMYDLPGITAAAHERGALMQWDLCHSAGAVPVDLTGADADIAVGCTYKYLNGGPGAPAFVYVADHLHDRIVQPIWGWFGQSDQFAMERPFEARTGIGRLLNGTPPVLGLTAAREGIRLTAEAGIGAIAAKARALTGLALDLADAHGLATDTPREPERRGGHVAVHHPDARRLHARLVERKVVVDHRDPDVLRFGLSPLTTRFVDVYDAFAVLSELA